MYFLSIPYSVILSGYSRECKAIIQDRFESRDQERVLKTQDIAEYLHNNINLFVLISLSLFLLIK